jgi:hypothetical protein
VQPEVFRRPSPEKWLTEKGFKFAQYANSLNTSINSKRSLTQL